MREYLEMAIRAAIDGGKEILKVYTQEEIKVAHKKDESPLTEADSAANTAINRVLLTTDFPIISEENKQLDYSVRKNWEYCWIVDPLDGTKEFIKKNGEFTVNIALCQDGTPILGVIYVPVTRELYYAVVEEKKAYKTILTVTHTIDGELYSQKDEIAPTKDAQVVRVVGSRSHMNDETHQFIETLKESYEEVEIVSKGSSLKFCLVAEGLADIYPRFAPTMEWDTAAGQAICNAVGLKVTIGNTGDKLTYNKNDLLNPFFLVSK
ncbi:MAG: 3'(2'),5'-bisphosphate nucleotidase CysQ [Flavobacteriaceae bacterium]